MNRRCYTATQSATCSVGSVVGKRENKLKTFNGNKMLKGKTPR